jgi:glycosyltransferase involved in cell wall biosynthesis
MHTAQTEAKRILFLDHTAQMSGGEIALLRLIAALDRVSYSPIVVLGSDGPLVGKMRELGVSVSVIPLDPTIVETRKEALGLSMLLKLKSLSRLLAYSRRLARLADDNKISLIHANSLKSDIYGSIAGRIAGIPTLWHVRDRIDGGYLPDIAARVFRSLSTWLPNAVVTNSQSTRSSLTGYKSTDSGTGNWVVYDGIGPKIAAGPTEELAKVPYGPPGAPVAALVGRIAPWKGQHIFIQAAERVVRQRPDAQFWIVGAPLFGEEAYESNLRRMTAELDLSKNVHFLGFRADAQQLMVNATIVVHASCHGEPFGQVVIEGMAAGKPVIATDGGAMPEIISDGVTGTLVPMNDPLAMANAIQHYLDSPERAAEIGLRGQQHVLENFTTTKTARSMEWVYEQIFASAKTASHGSLTAADLAIKGAQ